MISAKKNILPDIVLAIVVIYCIYYVIGVLLASSTIISVDGYYHIAVSKFIKKYGFLKTFPWTQNSIWKVLYSDKDLLLHILVLPITYFTDKISLIDKWGVAVINALYFTVFAYVMRKYIPPILAAILILLCFYSPTYIRYLTYLRPAILALTFTMLGLHFISSKNNYGILVVTFLFTLAHISAFTIVIFALISEIIRYLREKEFYKQNIIYSCLGFLFGLAIHPNFPSNIVTIYINGFLTPFYAFEDQGLDFGSEMFSPNARAVFLNQLTVFIYFAVMFWKILIDKVKISHTGFLFILAAQFYFALSFTGNRFWFMAVALSTLALAVFIRDAFFEGNPRPHHSSAAITAYIALSVFIIGVLPIRADEAIRKTKSTEASRIIIEQTALWMKENIPEGEKVFHSSWSLSPFLICLNPKNDYLVVLDPIYMYYWSPSVQNIYQQLCKGKEQDAYYHLKNTFKTRYGLTSVNHGFYELIDTDPRFKILYRNKDMVVFEVLKQGQ